MKALFYVALAVCIVAVAAEQTKLEWKIQQYPPMNMKVGDTLLVFWTDPALPHGFDKIPSGNCADLTSSNAVALHPVQAGPANYTWTASTGGTFWFACPVPGHCPAGMLLKITVA